MQSTVQAGGVEDMFYTPIPVQNKIKSWNKYHGIDSVF